MVDMTDVGIFGLDKHLSKIRIPQKNDRIYKDECVYSFDTPDTETGLYVCLQTFLGLGEDHLMKHFKRTSNAVYLHIKRDRIEKEEAKVDGPERKVTKLAIGVEGGFEPDKKTVDIHESYSVVVLPERVVIPYPCDRMPQLVISAVQGVLLADSASKLAELEMLNSTWDGEIRMVSKHAFSLPQLNNNKKIPPSGWKCDKCDLTTNLWLNLTDGSIMCGRRYIDGSGGNEHALNHYKETGYPLAVKLGTITKEGKGDVYSYDEDDMVEDPNLIDHLAHFGINIQSLEKTDKTMAELEVDLNQKYDEWAAIQETVKELKPAYGPGYTGLANMGNSCYLNTVVQVIFTVPDFINKYYARAEEIFSSAPSDPAVNFDVQMAKLGVGLLSGKYSKPPPEGPERKIIPHPTPHMFKNIIGKGHPCFSTKAQQDVHEFFFHLLETVQRQCRGSFDPTECFKFQIEERLECCTSGKVKYMQRSEYCLALSIPMEAATNKVEVAAFETLKAAKEKIDPSEVIRPQIPMDACFQAFSQEEQIEEFYSSAIQGKTIAKKKTRLSTFPDFLVIQLKKFTLQADWTPLKLDVSVDVPDTLDLSWLRSAGLQPGEELLPEVAGPLPEPEINMELAYPLIGQGFPIEAVKKALYFTKNTGVEEASAWLMQHITDSDFADPFVPPGTEVSQQKFVPNPEAVVMLSSMGFTEAQAIKALKATNNNIERAADWIFSHSDELDSVEEMETEGSSSSAKPDSGFRTGEPKYKLFAFISHMGTSTAVGHYVCHILKEGRWVIFNDEKVAFSEAPPKNLAYLYVYKRV